MGVALLDGAVDPLRELRRALSGRASLVAIDGLDMLTGADRDQAAALLRDAADRAASAAASPSRRRGGGSGHGTAARPLTVIASARREGAALDLLSDAHRPSVSALALGTGASAPVSASSSTQVIS